MKSWIRPSSLLKDQQDNTSPNKRKPEVYFNNVELNCFMRNSKNERKNESKRKVWLSEMMINRIQCLICYCLQFIHKSCDDTVIAAVRWTTWHHWMVRLALSSHSVQCSLLLCSLSGWVWLWFPAGLDGRESQDMCYGLGYGHHHRKITFCYTPHSLFHTV